MKKFLYDVFADRWYRGGSIYLYSDPHFNDEEMYYLRKNYIGDEAQVKSINAQLGKNDTIIFLGDIGDVEFIKRIRGYKVLVMGNHDSGASNYRRLRSEVEQFDSSLITPEDKLLIENNKEQILKNPAIVADLGLEKYFHKKEEDNHLFDEVYEGPVMISDRLLLSHEPLEIPPCFFNIHGHDHSKWFEQRNHLNVCAEHINYTPVPLPSLIKKGLLSNVESIHRLTIDRAVAKKLNKEKEK